MAKMNYLISGLPGTGKTSVCNELLTRGHNAIDADRIFGHQSGNDWLWDKSSVEKVTGDTSDETVFICGSASNRDEYIPLFERVFILHVDDATLEHRLRHRSNNNFGKDPVVLARQIARNQGVKEYSIKRGRIVIDATQSVDRVVNNILALTRD